jgi:hypothetical protein
VALSIPIWAIAETSSSSGFYVTLLHSTGVQWLANSA